MDYIYTIIMKNSKRIFTLALLCLSVMGMFAESANAQVLKTQPASAGDRIESTSYNDHKRGALRQLQYTPDGTDFVSVNGNNRYSRALYGGNTAWRLETSDRPIFATYVKKESRNIRFRLLLPNGEVTQLEETDFCESRYTPGKRSYCLQHKSWGEKAQLQVVVLTDTASETALWEITPIHLPKGTSIEAIVSPIKRTKLSRSGDIGADPPGSFDPHPEAAEIQRESWLLDRKKPLYVAMTDNRLYREQETKRFQHLENIRQNLADRIHIVTPDPFFNTLGGALSMAADGIWGTEGVWLHGAVGWRMPLSGWRAAYTGDVLGMHDRARMHFDNYAASQVTDQPCIYSHPRQDTTLAFARSEKKWGNPHYSNGYICRNPQRNNQMHHYDMNLCYIDELLWHLNWTGDLDYARKMWPVITAHLAWEKLNFDPDDDALYDAYACIWASDALYYNSGAVTHSTAYNHRANRMAAMIAEKIGEDPTPYAREADRILAALNERLWLTEQGHWAEFQDFMGHKRLHTMPGVWTIYHALDGDIANPFQAYSATRYVDLKIPHIAVCTDGHTALDRHINEGDFATISTTDWMPYSWSINNVAFAEVMHTSLAYFQAGRYEEGFKLLKSSVLDGMYLGESPGNFGQVSFYDAARGECYRDFGDPIGVASRVLIQGLYGILPDAMNGRILLKPGFPKQWDHASLHTPDIDFDFKTKIGALTTSYRVVHRLNKVSELSLQIPALYDQVEGIWVNGKKVDWQSVPQSVERPMLHVQVDAPCGDEVQVDIRWGGTLIDVAKSKIVPINDQDIAIPSLPGQERFALVEQGGMKWWKPLLPEAEECLWNRPTAASTMFVDIDAAKCEAIDMDRIFNARVTDIFRNQYLSPRSPYTTLQIPLQGIGEWCHPLMTAEIDDSGVRAAVDDRGLIQTSLGIPFRTPREGSNIAFTTLWDNYPTKIQVPLQGSAEHAYLLMAGSTNHMQSHIDNGMIRVYYADGTCDSLALVNPDNWPPIEQIFFEDGKAFNRHAPALYRMSLKSGLVSNDFFNLLGTTSVVRDIKGGAAVLLDMKLDSNKKLSHLELETLSNDVVIGIMSITLQR